MTSLHEALTGTVERGAERAHLAVLRGGQSPTARAASGLCRSPHISARLRTTAQLGLSGWGIRTGGWTPILSVPIRAVEAWDGGVGARCGGALVVATVWPAAALFGAD